MRKHYVRQKLITRFSRMYDATSGCWIWLGYLDDKGYGRFGTFAGDDAKIMGMGLAHRIAYRLYIGEIPSGAVVCHTCDEPRCVRPSHLFVGTQADNIRDMWRKGRARVPHRQVGEANHNARISWEDAKNIRHLYFAERRSQQEIAEFFGLTQPYVSRVARGLAWEAPC